MRSATRRAGLAAVTLGALGSIACGTVLGLNDYGNAPQDAGKDGYVAISSEGASGDGLASADDSTAPDSPAAAPEAGAEGASEDAVPDVGEDTTGDDGSAESDVGPEGAAGGGDAPSDAGLDAPGSPDGDGGYAPPPGWTLVAFSASPQTTCPPGFMGAALDVVFDTTTATPQAGACTCNSCTLTAPPSCVTGSIGGAYDTNGSGTCSTTSQALANASPGGCNTDEPKSTLGAVDVSWTAPAPSGGSCTSGAPTPNASRVSFASQGRVCTADADAGSLMAPAPFLECIAAAGTSVCPAGPFSVAHAVGTGATITCPSSCTCAPTATCANPTVTYYGSAACNGRAFAMPATGACNAENGGNTVYYSYKYTATTTGPTCTPGGTPAATVTGLAAEQTICCAP